MNVATNVRAVTVYTDRARVIRRGQAHLETGMHHLQVPGLPLSLNPESLRAAAKGDARARLHGVQLERTFYEETPQEQIRDLEAQLEQVQDELQRSNDRSELFHAERMGLLELAGQTEIFAAALASGEMSAQEHQSLLDNLVERAEALNTQLYELTGGQRELERRREKLQNELDRWRGQPRRQSYTADIEIEVLEPGNLEVELSYVVTGAGWQPLYDIRLVQPDGQDEMLEVNYLAQVKQRTGEAWPEVNLALSTARPALAGRLPELDPWYIQPVPPPAPAPRRMRSSGKPEMASLQAAAAESSPDEPQAMFKAAPAEIAQAAVTDSGPAVRYEVPGKVSIPEDGAPHKVTIARLSFPPDLDFATAPKVVPAVYRRARIENASPYTLLPGTVNLFFGEEYIGAAWLELVPAGGELELYLGTEDRLKVERELKRREVDKRLIGARRRVYYGYEITLENLLPAAVQVRLQDQLPVARHEEIKVKLESADPRPAEETELNLFTWQLRLDPKTRRRVRFDFSVEYPQDMEVMGLP